MDEMDATWIEWIGPIPIIDPEQLDTSMKEEFWEILGDIFDIDCSSKKPLLDGKLATLPVKQFREDEPPIYGPLRIFPLKSLVVSIVRGEIDYDSTQESFLEDFDDVWHLDDDLGSEVQMGLPSIFPKPYLICVDSTTGSPCARRLYTMGVIRQMIFQGVGRGNTLSGVLWKQLSQDVYSDVRSQETLIMEKLEEFDQKVKCFLSLTFMLSPNDYGPKRRFLTWNLTLQDLEYTLENIASVWFIFTNSFSVPKETRKFSGINASSIEEGNVVTSLCYNFDVNF